MLKFSTSSLFLIFLAFCIGAQAATFRVTKTADTADGVCDADCSLREAISAADSGPDQNDVIVFDPGTFGSARTIVLNGTEIVVRGDGWITIEGTGADLLSISGNNKSRVFHLTSGMSRLVLKDLTVTEGRADNGGGIRISGGSLFLENVTVRNNTATGNGGGIYENVVSSWNVRDSVFEGNTAQADGGAVYSGQGGFDAYDSVFRNNTAGHSGGGLWLRFGDIYGSVIDNNVASVSGGGVFGGSDVYTSIISNNVAVSGNGGGISNNSLSVQRSHVFNNHAGTNGGGISVSGSNLVNGVLSFSTVSGNTCNVFGAGVYSNGINLLVVVATVSGNRSENVGGGAFLNQGKLELKNSTIAGNTAVSVGGVMNDHGTVKITSTILGDNTSDNTPQDSYGAFVSEGNNLIEDPAETTFTGDTTTDIVGVDAKLLPLMDNGGPYPTHGLAPNSPALDKGRNPLGTNDQRFFPRPVDHPGIPNSADATDIGAFERQFSESPDFDFDGDSRTDISVFRPENGEWWYLRSSDGFDRAYGFGTATDSPVPADYTGDGRTDIAFFRGSDGEWFVLRSEDDTFYSFPFGLEGDRPAPGDFDGDGLADAAVYRPSNQTWYILNSTGGTSIEQFGVAEDLPVVADYDGDGRDDIAVYRPSVSEWWIDRSTEGVIAYQFGQTGDRTVQGDFTGDGRADVAFWRPSNGFWYVLRSDDSSFYSFPFGQDGDIPAPGDYDGDGLQDAAVYRPADATWFVSGSQSGTQVVSFGLPTDVPLPSVYSAP